jgi:polysaccharide pyruvyl transferase WcaK-like protein
MQNCRYVCVCLKSGKLTADSRRIVIAALRMLCRNENLLPIFLPLDESDLSVNAEAAYRLGGKLFLAEEPSDITAVLRGAQFLISMRLHGMILATAVSIPTVGIPVADDQKIPSFSRLSAQEFLSPEELSVAALVEICRTFCTRGSALRPLIANAFADLQKNAQKDLANIAAMVYNKDRYFKKK